MSEKLWLGALRGHSLAWNLLRSECSFVAVRRLQRPCSIALHTLPFHPTNTGGDAEHRPAKLNLPPCIAMMQKGGTAFFSEPTALHFLSFLRHQGKMQHRCGPRTVSILAIGALGAPGRSLTGSPLNLPGTTVFLIMKGNRCPLLLALHFACGSWVEESKWLSQVHNLW